jgi:histidinol phosphatase-like PHP family hydrolase/Icc-related predicted phosphoesterase
MSNKSLDILAISDFHFIDKAINDCTIEKRVTTLGPILLRKALFRLKLLGIEPGLIIMLGDMVNNGEAENAVLDLACLAAEARACGIPCLSVPGNHDKDQAEFARLFDCPPGLHEIGGYGFYVFHDEVGAGDITTRPEKALAELEYIAQSHPGLPLVALQHNPIFPHIQSEYPYMPANVETIRKSYQQAGVILSLSGHYHPGQDLINHNGVAYHTVPAICESPFSFSLIRLRGCEAQIEPHSLKLPTPGLADVHCHTQYAYCAEEITAEKNIEIASRLGLGKLYLTEHAYHLYLLQQEAWAFENGCAPWQVDNNISGRALRERYGRMDEYRKYVSNLRKRFPQTGFGLEVDLLADGSLFLSSEDREGWDILIGAIHYVPVNKDAGLSPAEIDEVFLRQNELMLQHPVQVLAHPFRWYRRAGLPAPRHLYPVLAEMLAKANVAAEINFHTNNPDPLFILECTRRKVKLVFGTDSHNSMEVGELTPHLRLLASVEK